MANKKKNNKSTKKKSSPRRVTTRKTNKQVEEDIADNSLERLIYLVLIIGFVFGAFYFATWLITRDKTKTEEDNSYKSGFSYTEIVAGRSFSMSDGNYYVMYYDKTDEDLEDTYSSAISGFRSRNKDTSLYTVNMGDGLNKSLVSENSNTHPNSAQELAINGPTLIEFNNHEVVNYYEGEDSIKSVLE